MEKLKNLKYGKDGITLIALVVTIMVLLILAGISIGMIFGENGLISRATGSAEEYEKAELKEKIELLLSEYVMENVTRENTNFEEFLRENLQVGIAQNNDNTYSFILGEWQVKTDQNKVISIEKFEIDIDKTFSNVETMKLDTELTEGELVKTEGYWDKQYGGSAYYDIVSSTILAVDDGKCIKLENGLYAELHSINDTVTVNQFGAYGDGVHDDALMIQKALNSGYNNIEFENNEYNIKSIIYVNTDNISIIGNGANISNTNNLNSIFQFEGTNEDYLNNIYIGNISLNTGNIIEDTISGQIRCKYVDKINIVNCEINSRQANSSAILFQNVRNSNIKNCSLSNFKKGIFATDTVNSNINNNIILFDRVPNENYSDGFYGISFDNYTNKTKNIENININNNLVSGYTISVSLRYSNNSKITNNSIENTSFGITIDRSSNIEISNNDITMSSKITNGHLYIELVCSNNCVVKSNKCSCEAYYGTGVGVYGETTVENYNEPSDNIIENNIFQHISMPITVSTNAKNTKVINNIIEDCKVGITINVANIDGLEIKNNVINNCCISGIHYKDIYPEYNISKILIQNNKIKNCNDGILR